MVHPLAVSMKLFKAKWNIIQLLIKWRQIQIIISYVKIHLHLIQLVFQRVTQHYNLPQSLPNGQPDLQLNHQQGSLLENLLTFLPVILRLLQHHFLQQTPLCHLLYVQHLYLPCLQHGYLRRSQLRLLPQHQHHDRQSHHLQHQLNSRHCIQRCHQPQAQLLTHLQALLRHLL
jgi:hypothetical protein